MSGTKIIFPEGGKNKKGVKLFTKQDDKSLRFNKKTGKWIKHRKTTYLYWYKFLQVCLKEGYKIDRSKYRGWDLDSIVDMRFNDWWDIHSEKLFAVKNKKDTPKVELSTKFPRRESIRMSWLVYFYDKPNDKSTYKNLKIAYKIIKRESINRYLSHSNDNWFPTDKDGMPLKPEILRMFDDDISNQVTEVEKSKSKDYATRIINENERKASALDMAKHKRYLKHRNRISDAMSEHRMKYKKIIKNVCKGQFP